MVPRAQPEQRRLAGMRPARSARPAPRGGSGTRGVATPRVTIGRRPPPKSATTRILGRLARLLPGVGAAKGRPARRPGAKATAPAGVALFAGAAGLAFKNRETLKALLPGTAAEEQSPPTAPAPETTEQQTPPTAPAPETTEQQTPPTAPAPETTEQQSPATAPAPETVPGTTGSDGPTTPASASDVADAPASERPPSPPPGSTAP